MFALSPATKVYLAAGATDLRKGFDGLCAIVEGVLGEAALALFPQRRPGRRPADAEGPVD